MNSLVRLSLIAGFASLAACTVDKADASGSEPSSNTTVPSYSPISGTGVQGLFTFDIKLVDVEADGSIDLVVSSGSDWMAQPLIYYSYQTNSAFGQHPSWIAPIVQFGMGFAAADLNQDSLVDLAVAIKSDLFRDTNKGGLHIYLSSSAGLSTQPIVFEGFTASDVAAADLDGDGDVDLVVAEPAPESGGRVKASLRVLTNNGGGRFEHTWQSEGWGANRVLVDDINRDGYFDIVSLGPRVEVRYGSSTGSYSKKADWDAGVGLEAFGLDVVVLPNELRVLVASSTGLQLFSPIASKEPVWSDNKNQSVLTVRVFDVNSDGQQDFLTGEYKHKPNKPASEVCPTEMIGDECIGGKTRLYLGTVNGFQPQPGAYPKQMPITIVQDIEMANLYHPECFVQQTQTFKSRRNQRVYRLDDNYVHRVESVSVNGRKIPRATGRSGGGLSYVAVPNSSWISIADVVPPSASVEVIYTTSDILDLAIGTGSPNMGTLLYMSDQTCKGAL